MLRPSLYVALGACLACGEAAGPPTGSSLEMIVPAVRFTAFGDTVRLTATLRAPNGDSVGRAAAIWTARDTVVATVHERAGLVTARGNGSTVIRGVVDGVRDSVWVSVSQEIDVIEVIPSAATMTTHGHIVNFAALARDANGNRVRDVTYEWSVDDPRVVGVHHQTGSARARQDGSSLVRATAAGRSGTAQITVARVPGRIELTTANPYVAESDTARYTAVVLDRSGVPIEAAVTWSVLDSSRLQVSSDGVVTPLPGAGLGTETVRAHHGTLTGTAVVFVLRAVAFMDLSADALQVCALSADSLAYCWGSSRRLPVPVPGAMTFASLSVGTNHLCGLRANGELRCWGANQYGQLGIGNHTAQGTPQLVPGGPYAAVSAGRDHTCALRTDGVAFCWGRGDGRLGIGVNPNAVNLPESVATDVQFVDIAAGGQSSCALTAAGVGYCWGSNDEGQLGSGWGPTVRWTPHPMTPADTFARLRVGWLHACAVGTTGTGYCWGRSVAGRLGRPVTAEDEAEPHPVSGGHTFIDIRPGVDHTCGWTVAGEAWCWGSGQWGQLGSGALGNAAAPVAVAGGHTFVRVVASSVASCGLTTSGHVWCWGRNISGDLGVPVPASGSLTPVRVTGVWQ